MTFKLYKGMYSKTLTVQKGQKAIYITTAYVEAFGIGQYKNARLYYDADSRKCLIVFTNDRSNTLSLIAPTANKSARFIQCEKYCKEHGIKEGSKVCEEYHGNPVLPGEVGITWDENNG